MFVYKLSTYSHEEHREILVSSMKELSQEDLNKKLLNLMERSAKRFDEDYHKRKRRSFRDFSQVFNDLTDADYALEGLLPIKPKLSVFVSAWEAGSSNWTDVELENKAPDNITKDLCESLKKQKIRCQEYYCPWHDENDEGDYEEDRSRIGS